MRRLLFSALLLPFLLLQTRAQNVSPTAAPAAPTAAPAAPAAPAASMALGQSVVVLNGPWKFRVGDEPDWSDPTYDDSSWENISLTPRAGSYDPTTGWPNYVAGWIDQGHPDYWGYAWYRIRVQLDVRPGESFALIGPPNVNDAYQVFANGALLGSFGKFPGNGTAPVAFYSQPRMFQIPHLNAEGPQVLVLAFRVWMQPLSLLRAPDAGGFHTAPLVGDADAIAANYQLAKLGLIRTYEFGAITGVLFCLLAIMAASLTMFDRADRVYWWLAFVFLLTAIQSIAACIASWTHAESIPTAVFLQDVLLGPLILGGWVMVWWAWFRLRDLPWMPKFIAFFTVMYAISNALGEDIFYNAIPHPVSALFRLISVGIRILFLLPLMFIVIEGVNTEGWEGLLALPAVMLVVVAQFQDELSILHFRTNWFPFGVQVTIAEIAYLALAAVIFVLLLRRLMLSLQHQREVETDVKQAQEVQQILIPEELPQVPGLKFESEYRPARDVGGDFFQIIPNPDDGSALIVAGDVTGKGLQAGMLGALIVGAARTESAHSNDPAVVLRAINNQLVERGHAHATCLALRISIDGDAVLANAGHLPPYLNGKELPIEGSLPLGMILDSDLSELRFVIDPSDRLILLSDGVVEAQNEEGRLFGFDRVRQMLTVPITAAEIATAAQQFGQTDDISVVAITRVTIPGQPVIWRSRATTTV
ncbi:MAG: SpoIIE family protein phosphatase [Silvibacterium sp.]